MNQRICAVVVTYKTGPQIGALLDALLAQVAHVYIVDNGSDTDIIALLKEYSASNKNTTLICNATNMGVAVAQNQAIRLAIGAGFDWLLLMDDDSRPQADMVQKMLSAFKQQDDSKIGIIAPRLVEQNISVASRHLVPCCGIGFRRQVVDAGHNLLEAVTVIASGSLVKMEVFQNIGLMREGFFIDYVDHEFCLRARSCGYKIMVVGDAVLNHRQGNKRYENIAGVMLKTLNYNPTRYYYIFRNRMFFLRLYAKGFPFLIIHDGLACSLDIFRIIVREKNKKEKLSAMFRGLKDGITKEIPVVNR